MVKKKNFVFPTLDVWLKQWVFEKKNYQSRVGNDGMPRISDFKEHEYYIINYNLQKEHT